MEIRGVVERDARREAVPILRHLWSDADPDEILEWTGEDDYHLFGGFVDDESRRGESYGTKLVSFGEAWARERDCESVALASPLAKTDVHEYYEGLEFDQWGYIIEKEL